MSREIGQLWGFPVIADPSLDPGEWQIVVSPGRNADPARAAKRVSDALRQSFPGVDEIEIRWPAFVVRHRPFDWMVDA